MKDIFAALYCGNPFIGGAETRGKGYSRIRLLPSDMNWRLAGSALYLVNKEDLLFPIPLNDWKNIDWLAMVSPSGVPLLAQQLNNSFDIPAGIPLVFRPGHVVVPINAQANYWDRVLVSRLGEAIQC